MTGDEDEIVLIRPPFAPFEVMLQLRRFSVLVGAEETDVQIITRIFEIVGVAAKKGNLLLRRENDPDICITLETVKMIASALVKGHDVAAQAGFVLRFFLDFGHNRPPSLEGSLIG